MSAWSYFWDSQEHLSSGAFSLELGGAIIEVIVGIVIVSTFHKEWNEQIKKRLEFLFEVAFLVAAIITTVAILSNRRIDTLRKKDEEAAFKETEKQRNETQIAAKTASEASESAKSQADKLAAANATIAELKSKAGELENKIQPRTINEDDKKRFIKLLENTPRGDVEVHIQGNSGAEVQNFAESIRQMITDAGYNTGQMCSQSWGGGQIPQGVGIGVKSTTNQPPFAGPMQAAFRMVGIDVAGYVDPGLGTNTVKIYVGSKP